MYPQIALDDGRTFTNLVQIFDRGFKLAGPTAPYIGYRPTVSTNPLKFADHFVWSTWGEVAKRRLDVGSGIENLFHSGDAIKANGLETVGVWSANTPGESSFHVFSSWLLGVCLHVFNLRAIFSQNGGSLILLSRCTEKSSCLSTKTLAQVQLVCPQYPPARAFHHQLTIITRVHVGFIGCKNIIYPY